MWRIKEGFMPNREVQPSPIHTCKKNILVKRTGCEQHQRQQWYRWTTDQLQEPVKEKMDIRGTIQTIWLCVDIQHTLSGDYQRKGLLNWGWNADLGVHASCVSLINEHSRSTQSTCQIAESHPAHHSPPVTSTSGH